MTERTVREKRLEAETGAPKSLQGKIMIACMITATAAYTTWVFFL